MNLRTKTILFVAALTATSLTRAALTPIPLASSSFTEDVVVEKTATPVLKVVTTATVDQGTNNGANTWMEVGYDPANPYNGLPAPGTVVTPPYGDLVLGGGANTVTGVNAANPGVVNYSFKMPPDYTAPNGILIYGDGTTGLATGTFTLTTPAPYALLSFAGSGGNGGCVVGVTVHHADGTTETGQFGCPDWFNGTSNVVFIANERCGSSVNFTYANVNSGNPRIYFRDITLANTTSPVTSIDLSYVSGPANSRNDVLAVSGAATVGGPVTPIEVTGYTYDFIVEAAAGKRGRVMDADGFNNATTQAMDSIDNTGNSWYERGYNVNNPDGGGVPIPDPRVATITGLPPAGTTVTNDVGDHIYVMPPDYSQPNALWLPPASSGTITLETPTAATVLSLLGGAGGGAINNAQATVNHEDGSSELHAINIPDWFNATPYVFGANGRVDVGSAQFNNVRNTAFNPRLYPIDLVLENSTSPVTSIDIVNPNETGGRGVIFALSGTSGPVKPSFTTQPQSVTVAVGVSVQFTAVAAAPVPITYRWQKGTNGVFVDVIDGGTVSGATTTTLTVNPVAESDDADYRLVASSSAGSENSAAAVLTVISALADVTQPGDMIVAYNPNGGSSPAAESVDHAIDNVTQKYLNYGNGATPMVVPVGFVVKPSIGRTIVTAMRLYSANDATERDPANYVLEGSINGGVTWTLISSGAITMPDGRNEGGQIALAPLTQAIRQVRFANTDGYTSYRWYTTQLKASSSMMQIAEVELLGVVDASPAPYFSTEPMSTRAYAGSPAALTAVANGTPAPTLLWKRNIGSGLVELTDGGNIAGAKTGTLTINPVTAADAGDYVCVASNAAGTAETMPATLTILSSLEDITQPGDTIVSFGDTSTTYPTEVDPNLAIDNSTTRYRNGGIGLNAYTGFPPYEGPAGVVITPAVGYTLVTGLRLYTAEANIERDPTAYELAGSEDGTTFTAIVSGVLTPDLGRNAAALGLDPLTQPMQEVLFPNPRPYTSYRFTVNHVRTDIDANSFQFAELELLGIPVAPPATLSVALGVTSGTVTITTTAAGTLWSSADLKSWRNDGEITPATPLTVTIAATGPARFYQIKP